MSIITCQTNQSQGEILTTRNAGPPPGLFWPPERSGPRALHDPSGANAWPLRRDSGIEEKRKERANLSTSVQFFRRNRIVRQFPVRGREAGFVRFDWQVSVFKKLAVGFRAEWIVVGFRPGGRLRPGKVVAKSSIQKGRFSSGPWPCVRTVATGNATTRPGVVGMSAVLDGEHQRPQINNLGGKKRHQLPFSICPPNPPAIEVSAGVCLDWGATTGHLPSVPKINFPRKMQLF